jgi:hypothetical protein
MTRKWLRQSEAKQGGPDLNKPVATPPLETPLPMPSLRTDVLKRLNRERDRRGRLREVYPNAKERRT